MVIKTFIWKLKCSSLAWNAERHEMLASQFENEIYNSCQGNIKWGHFIILIACAKHIFNSILYTCKPHGLGIKTWVK